MSCQRTQEGEGGVAICYVREPRGWRWGDHLLFQRTQQLGWGWVATCYVRGPKRVGVG